LSALALVDPALAALGVRHGFGVRGLAAPEGILRPRQVHGATAVRAEACRGPGPAPEADAVVAIGRGAVVGVVTADCVPILHAEVRGAGVAAVHAGWRGLARGVVDAGVRELARASGAPPTRIAAAIGPHIGACCYEVDAPVLEAVAAQLGQGALASAAPVRPGHWLLDLGALALLALMRAGVPRQAIGSAAARCTACDAERFHSHRRDGAGAGRLVHFVEVPWDSGGGGGEA
jgi:YfiH family protein